MTRKTALTSMTISLPTTQKDFVRARAAATGCSTPSEYIRRLIHADELATRQADLERKVLEGLDSELRELSPEEWQAFRETLRAKLPTRRRAR